ncbi:MAG TPA: RidA family protein [Spirochaetales bacterium]|nr:RidA family protein [Spirochaetales bacterium]HRY55800.1 RidA family protein [Spirochaetia bacterium]HRZ65865.1 RidA family protein [Spirochaetia bacterium]
MKKAIATEKAPKALGPYSQGIAFGNLLFVSGQTPIVPADGTIPAGVVEQSKRALENVKAVVEAAGASMASVLKTTVFLKDMKDFPAMNEVYASYFAGTFPARSTVEVARLPKDVLVEIEAIVGL